MGQKVHPKLFRLGITDDWDSIWFEEDGYKKNLLEDYIIRKFLNNELSRAGLSKLRILRKSDQLEVHALVSRPGIIFGKSSLDLEVITDQLQKKIKKKLSIKIIENNNPDNTATLLASWICAQIEKRVPFRRAMKMGMQKCLKSGAKGVKILSSGRLGGVEIARSEGYKEGKVPLHTLRAEIDYALKEAKTTYGIIGVKVWIYKGEKINRKESELVKPKKN
jgi:small subunit ribosomal protein S3